MAGFTISSTASVKAGYTYDVFLSYTGPDPQNAYTINISYAGSSATRGTDFYGPSTTVIQACDCDASFQVQVVKCGSKTIKISATSPIGDSLNTFTMTIAACDTPEPPAPPSPNPDPPVPPPVPGPPIIPPTPFPPHIPGMDCDNHFWGPYAEGNCFPGLWPAPRYPDGRLKDNPL